MALNGIDIQIAVQRGMDYSKDMSNVNKKNELMQDYLSQQAKAEAEIQNKSVNQIESKDDPRIREKNKDQQESPSKRKKKGNGENNNETDEEDTMPEEEVKTSRGGRIDIRI